MSDKIYLNENLEVLSIGEKPIECEEDHIIFVLEEMTEMKGSLQDRRFLEGFNSKDFIVCKLGYIESSYHSSFLTDVFFVSPKKEGLKGSLSFLKTLLKGYEPYIIEYKERSYEMDIKWASECFKINLRLDCDMFEAKEKLDRIAYVHRKVGDIYDSIKRNRFYKKLLD